MTEERRPRPISTMPRLSPEDVANRAFATSFRGYAEAEVRSFLKRVSEELAAMREREQELLGAVDDLENRLAAPRPLDEKELLEALGEETTRLLRNAREAADDIRQKSEERAARIVEDAQAEAQRLRHEASEILAIRTTEAEAAASEIQRQTDERVNEQRAESERYFEEQRLRAEQEADALVENARTQGRQMVEEAKALRERVLADLARRRGLLQAQLEELRNGRDHLLEAYRVVKRTFLEATEALAQAEARAASGAPLPSAVAPDAEETAPEEAVAPVDDVATDADEGAAAAEVDDAASATEQEADAGDALEAAPAAPLPDVDTLFARIRAGAEAAPGVEEAVAAAEATTGEPAEPGEPGTEVAGGAALDTEGGPAGEPSETSETGAPAADDHRATWQARASETVTPLVSPLVKQAKRAAQDEQNALLDALRRHKGQPTSAQVLQSERDTIAAWAGVLRNGLDTAYGAGRTAVGGEAVAAPPDLSEEAVRYLVDALRERLATAIDDDNDGFSTSLVIERIGARYREWKLQALDGMVEGVHISAWSRGVYDAAPDGALLQWVSAHEGRCPDCDDNALEPTVKGESFPTGQLYPPAHPGCRCVLALVGAEPNVP